MGTSNQCATAQTKKIKVPECWPLIKVNFGICAIGLFCLFHTSDLQISSLCTKFMYAM